MKLTYQIVEHNDGWAYKVGDTFSETFDTHDQAEEAAQRAASEQKISDETHDIEYEDAEGEWHEESSDGTDRPETEVRG